MGSPNLSAERGQNSRFSWFLKCFGLWVCLGFFVGLSNSIAIHVSRVFFSAFWIWVVLGFFMSVGGVRGLNWGVAFSV